MSKLEANKHCPFCRKITIQRCSDEGRVCTVCKGEFESLTGKWTKGKPESTLGELLKEEVPHYDGE